METMVQQKTYSERLACSKVVKDYINDPCKELFKKRYPESEGSNITTNQILTDMIKKYLSIFHLENDTDRTNKREN